ncbi:g- coupled receptor [Fusarium longipes]|uniref:G-coupled receptor n=1 Tax=Fusarium longipes TaxID=694270 RepID=A0A395SWJ0_9HYPO|nr:g- coupled receptor [Fusarium longipes]
MVWGELPREARTLDPLSDDLRHGLTAVTVLAFISFFSSSILFSYLVYKLTTWCLFIKSQSDGHFHQQAGPIQRAIDFSLGIDGIFSDNNEDVGKKAHGELEPRKPNQFLVLIINLLLADMHQGVAFFLNAAWLQHNAILVGTATCYTQGLFVSLGDLASSMFITAIAVHTYMAVVKGRQTPQNVLYGAIVAIWVFVYAISFIPIAATSNGAEFGGFFVRAGSWCWMNKKYENLRLFTHYLYIFLGLGTTSILYTIIFFHIRRQARLRSSEDHNDTDSVQLQLSRNPAFLIYPVIYVLCTLPLAAGRIATMAGAKVPNGYFCFAGAMIASNGSFDCLLFGTTRNTIVFASKYDVASNNVGLSTFAFLKTPTNRRFGNTISIQGGRQRDEDVTTGGWWTWPARGTGSSNRSHRGMTRTTSQESLRGPAIQMDTVTSVVVEVDDSAERDSRYPDTTTSSNPSLLSTDKDFSKVTERSLDGHR